MLDYERAEAQISIREDIREDPPELGLIQHTATGLTASSARASGFSWFSAGD
jgi:hypothetical protein